MSIFRTFPFTATTIDGDIKEFPVLFNLRCDLVVPIGRTIIRQFNGEQCIVARKVFLVYYDGQNLGTDQFKTLDEFLLWRNNNCTSSRECNLLYNGCSINYGNCFVKYKR